LGKKGGQGGPILKTSQAPERCGKGKGHAAVGKTHMGGPTKKRTKGY